MVSLRAGLDRGRPNGKLSDPRPEEGHRVEGDEITFNLLWQPEDDDEEFDPLVNWAGIVAAFGSEFGWTPEEIGRLSRTQIALINREMAKRNKNS